MRNVSSRFLEAMKTRTDFKEYATITLVDGSAGYILNESNFTVSGNSFTDGSGSNSFPLGQAIAKQIQMEIWNGDGRYDSADFHGARIHFYLSLDLKTVPATKERIDLGYYTVAEPSTYGDTVIITALDDMCKFNRKFATNASFPMTAGQLLLELGNICGVAVQSTTFFNSDVVITEKPSHNYHCRIILGYIASIAGGNAVINSSGKLEIKTYNLSVLNNSSALLDTASEAINDSSATPIAVTYPYEEWADQKGMHVFHSFQSAPYIGHNPIVITGVSFTTENDETLTTGSEGYVISVENNLSVNNMQGILESIGTKLIGYEFYDFELDSVAYPIVEFMDTAFIKTRKGCFPSVVTDVNFVFNGFTTIKNSAEPQEFKAENIQSAQSIAVIKADKLVREERTARETAMQNMAEQLAKNTGFFQTAQAQPDGSVVMFLHNKPVLEESMLVWKITAEAIGISSDGGITYPYGLDSGGVAILERIYAVGLDADYITTGAFTVKDSDGNVIFSADKTTGKVMIKALTDFQSELGRYIRFNNSDGSLEFGKAGNPVTLKIINDRISFSHNGVEIAYFSNNKLYVKDIEVTGTAILCGLVISKSGNIIRID